MRSTSLRDAAVFAGAGLVGLGTGWPARDFADAALELLGGDRAGPFEAAIERGAAFVEALEHKLEDRAIEPLTTTVRAIVREHRLSLREAYDLEAGHPRESDPSLDGARIAAALLERGADHLVGLDPVERDLVRRAIAAVYESYLHDRGSVERMMPEVIARLFQMAERMTGLERRVADCLVELRSALLLHSGRRPLPSWAGPDSWLLRPEYGVAPFHPAREAALAELRDWAGSDAPLAIRLIHGRGGAGKTRLATELVSELRGSWRAGLLDAHEPTAPRAAIAALFDDTRPTLVVIDYAETRREEIVQVIEEAARERPTRRRILLVARAKAEWWDVLARASARVAEVMGALASAAEVPALPNDTAVRRSLYEAACRAYAEAMGEAPASERAVPELDHESYDLPLFVHLAAIAAVRGRPLMRGDQLLEEVLVRERRFWDRRLTALGLEAERYGPLVAQAVALTTWVGGCRDRSRIRHFVSRVPLAEGTAAVDLNAIATLLAELYPSPGELGALRPDLLGEELFAVELERDDGLYARTIDA